MKDSLFEVSWDRGKRTSDEIIEKHIYQFKCDCCGGENLHVEPFDVAYLHEVNNKDLPREYALTLYSNALRLDKALIACTEMRVTCNDCNTINHYKRDRIREDFVKRWYTQVYKKGALDLSGGVGSDIK